MLSTFATTSLSLCQHLIIQINFSFKQEKKSVLSYSVSKKGSLCQPRANSFFSHISHGNQGYSKDNATMHMFLRPFLILHSVMKWNNRGL